MTAPVKITYRHMEPSAALDETIHTWTTKLDVICEHVVEWRVVVEAPHHHHDTGKHFVIHVVAVVPGEELVVDRDPPKASHAEAHIAVADAFRAMKRQVVEYVRVRRHEVKPHSLPSPT